MAIPTTKATFKSYCLRALGSGVIDINVSDDQADDRIDEALQYFSQYHYDGVERMYLKHLITSDDVTRATSDASTTATDKVDDSVTATWKEGKNYIPVPDAVLSVVEVFPFYEGSTSNMFDVRYQLRLNDLYDLSRYDLVPFYMNFQNIRFIEEILVGKQPLRFNRHVNRLHIDMDWDKLEVGQFLVAHVYEKVDGDTYTDIWGDRWLAEYATCLIKYQWGSNLSKFTGMQLPGGVQFNGADILSQAQQEKDRLEQEMISSYSLPVHDMTG